jgi:hypothetical protein
MEKITDCQTGARKEASPYTFTRFYKQNGTESPEHLCNAEPGEMRQWSGWRNKALKAESAGTAK